MPANNMTCGGDSSPNAGARLRTVGVFILLLGLGAAVLVYWTGVPPEDLSENPATAGMSKKEARDIEINLGKAGLLMNDFMADLEQPGTQAILIAIASILAASGCFYFARLPTHRSKSDSPPR